MPYCLHKLPHSRFIPGYAHMGDACLFSCWLVYFRKIIYQHKVHCWTQPLCSFSLMQANAVHCNAFSCLVWIHGQAYFYGSAWAYKRILFQIQGLGFTPVWSIVVDCFCRSGLIYGQLYLFCCGCTWSHHVNQCSCWPRSSLNQEVVFWVQQSYYYPTSPFPAYKNTHTHWSVSRIQCPYCM